MAGRVLITGAGGFIGSKLLRALTRQGYEAHERALNLLDAASVEAAVRAEPWDQVVHLAAISHVPTCEKDPELAARTNTGGTALLLEALRQHRPEARLVFASTAQVYAAPSGEELQGGPAWDESRPVTPQNTYARTKRESELLIERAADDWGLKATVLRLFNHTHCSQSAEFFLPHIYADLTQAKGGTARIPVGNLDVERDLGAVQDLVAALVAVVGRSSVQGSELFNVCNGRPRHLGRLAAQLAERLGVRAKFVTDPSRVRAGEPKRIVGSHARLTASTGWEPRRVADEDFLQAFLDVGYAG